MDTRRSKAWVVGGALLLGTFGLGCASKRYVGDEGSKNLAHLEQAAPVLVGAGQSRDLPAADDSHLP